MRAASKGVIGSGMKQFALAVLPLMVVSVSARADGPVPNAWVGTVTTTLRYLSVSQDSDGGKTTTTTEERMTVQIPDSGPAQAQVSGSYSQDAYGISGITEYCGAAPGDGKGTVVTTTHSSGSGQASATGTGNGYQPSLTFNADGPTRCRSRAGCGRIFR